jgi:hypothetical protein
MELYSGIMKQTEELLAGSSGTAWAFEPSGAWPDVGKNELIMQREAAFELGGSGLQAVSYSCVTTDASHIARDEVLLYGPDLGKLKADSPYARIVFVTVRDIGEADAAYSAVQTLDFVRYHVFPRGFMMRALPDDCREQVRVGRDAVKAGISFRSVGFDFIRKYRENPVVKNVRVVFVTDPGAPYKALRTNAKKVTDITRSLSTILDGMPTDCASCNFKPICDEVEGMKELHFSQRKM